MKTDSQLQQDVIAELKWEPAVHGTQIGVEVSDGIVTLAGSVDSFLEKWEAERAAQRVNGVRALAMDIEVKLPAFSQRDDTDIARSAENALDWMDAPIKDGVKVMVENGWITLSGQVPWFYQKQSAMDGIRHLAGVVGVSNHITIAPSVTLSEVKSEIEAALARQARLDAQNISVHVNGADVTLTGTVASWSERDSARKSAWNAPGVRNVVDNMAIAF